MTHTAAGHKNYFTPFAVALQEYELPLLFNYPFDYQPHPLALLAADHLQTYLTNQTDWIHNFGLENELDTTVIGKMFGVLVVENEHKQLGYLSAFSGKLAGTNLHAKFVPPVYDMLQENDFVNKGMEGLGAINQSIKNLENSILVVDKEEINRLKILRKSKSQALQNIIFDHYEFTNQSGDLKNLRNIFKLALNKRPPSGAGECAAPKLLQYAFTNHLKPIALAEFWWGQSPKSVYWQHGHFYPCCIEKCKPILDFMLQGTPCEKAPIAGQ
jgi:tRNA pseudouridine32 synthase / 23S rRNA pseudouridine746 synthase